MELLACLVIGLLLAGVAALAGSEGHARIIQNIRDVACLSLSKILSKLLNLMLPTPYYEQLLTSYFLTGILIIVLG